MENATCYSQSCVPPPPSAAPSTSGNRCLTSLPFTSQAACCDACANTLGCLGFSVIRQPLTTKGSHFASERLSNRRSCCLQRFFAEACSLGDDGGQHERSGQLLSAPCTARCLLPAIAGASSSERVSLDDVPWLAPSLWRAGSPEAPPDAAARSRRAIRVAVCLAGQARTFAHPAVWRSVREHLLEDGRHELFLVLATGSLTAAAASGWNDQRVTSPCELRDALEALAPRATRLVVDDFSPPAACGSAPKTTRQFQKWAACAELVERHEAATGGAYDYIFRSRPDVLWRASPRVERLARGLAGEDVVLTANDRHLLIHRSRWGVLRAMREMECHAACRLSNRSAAPWNEWRSSRPRHGPNEYCLLLAHLATHGIRQVEAALPPPCTPRQRFARRPARHRRRDAAAPGPQVEAAHPRDECVLHYSSSSPVTAALRSSAGPSETHRISRWRYPLLGAPEGAAKYMSDASVPNKWRAPSTGVRRPSCTAPPLRCEYCAAVEPAASPDQPHPCPPAVDLPALAPKQAVPPPRGSECPEQTPKAGSVFWPQRRFRQGAWSGSNPWAWVDYPVRTEFNYSRLSHTAIKGHLAAGRWMTPL